MGRGLGVGGGWLWLWLCTCASNLIQATIKLVSFTD